MDTLSSVSHLHEEILFDEDVFFWDIRSEPKDFKHSMLEEQPILTSSAFVKYLKPNYSGPTIITDNGRANVHHRLIRMVRGIQKDQSENNENMMYKKNEYSRGFQHMMRERQRREKLSQSYADLHSMLPHSSKADKISIVQSATAYVKDREMVKEVLLKRNIELINAAKGKRENKEGEKIRICIADNTSALDSMIGAVRRLKEMKVEAMSIQTQFSDHERIAIVNLQTRLGHVKCRELSKVLGYSMLQNPIP